MKVMARIRARYTWLKEHPECWADLDVRGLTPAKRDVFQAMVADGLFRASMTVSAFDSKVRRIVRRLRNRTQSTPRRQTYFSPPFTVDQWKAMDYKKRNYITAGVFGIRDEGFDIRNLGSARKVWLLMLENGWCFEFTELETDKLAGIYCLMDRNPATPDTHVGWGPTLSEALCSAALKATQFLVQRT